MSNLKPRKRLPGWVKALIGLFIGLMVFGFLITTLGAVLSYHQIMMGK